jgi:uncharacterized circularly permuted ATP-grasp superfamily protein/uncharacterized alpha-E superfamily protein
MTDSAAVVAAWRNAYHPPHGAPDTLTHADQQIRPAWDALLGTLADHHGADLGPLAVTMGRLTREIGMAYRLPGDTQERAWPVSPLPLLIGERQWQGIAEAIAERAELLEAVLADVYGPQAMVASGDLPAPVVTGSRDFWRQMIGVAPSGGHHLQFYAADLGQGPDGRWWVLADRTQAPSGAGYALENRLVTARVLGGLFTRLNVRRLAPFFATLRKGIAATSPRAEPRIGLLTPGRYSDTYAEQAHLARYLGFLLVEGDDLAVNEGRLFVRTIAGLKRVDAIWRRLDARFLDPLAFDAHSAIGVPGLLEALRQGTVAVSNMPGSGVVETSAFAAFLPRLARRVLGRNLAMPNIATWWCGQDAEREHVEANIDRLVLAPAFENRPFALDIRRNHLGVGLDEAEREALRAALRRRPQDYVGQEVVRVSTTPAWVNGQLQARPFVLRVFAARTASGSWTVMPGGFARLSADSDIRAIAMGSGVLSADVCVMADEPQAPVSLLPEFDKLEIRRVAGILPSRAADNLFWLGRYLERAEMTLRIARALLGGTLDADGASARAGEAASKLVGLLVAWGAVPAKNKGRQSTRLSARNAIDGDASGSVRALLATAREIALGIRERISLEVWRQFDREYPPLADADRAAVLERANLLIDKFAALSGFFSENTTHSAGWRFLDLGRRIERAVNGCRLVRRFADNTAQGDDLNVLLDLLDAQITYRQRYIAGLALEPTRDLAALDPYNPRSIAFQVERLRAHLAELPVLNDDGMLEEPLRLMTVIAGEIAGNNSSELDADAVLALEQRLMGVSEAIARRYFLQGGDAARASSMVQLA